MSPEREAAMREAVARALYAHPYDIDWGHWLSLADAAIAAVRPFFEGTE